jgi:N-acetylmuramoyl-L-alanine amidase
MRWIKPTIEPMACGPTRRGAVIALVVVAAVSVPAFAQAPAAPMPRFVVVLDAAHGGDDTGGHSSDWMEKNLTLALSVRLRSLLMARGIPVVTTRESDTTLDAGQRDAIANHADAQVCITLHGSLTGTGVHLFASSIAPAAQVKFIPWKTAQAPWVTESVALEGVVNSALLHAGFTVTAGRTAMPVLDSMTCPAIAVEVSPDKSATVTPAESLNDAAYQARVTDGLAAAILEWRSEGPHLQGSGDGSVQGAGQESGAGTAQP